MLTLSGHSGRSTDSGHFTDSFNSEPSAPSILSLLISISRLDWDRFGAHNNHNIDLTESAVCQPPPPESIPLWLGSDWRL